MADVIFRGVKNPANCSECFFWAICPCLADFDDYSAILDAVHDGNLVRHEECPVSPLPEGHGRLIDADALRTRMYETMDYQDLYLPIHFEMCMGDVPTIIEAEGGTEDGN